MILSDILFKTPYHTVALIGSGGKTTMIRTLARENRTTKQIFVSNTLNMERIPESEVDFIDYQFREDYSLSEYTQAGVYVLAYGIEPDNSLRGLPLDVLEKQMDCFELCLIECDESRQRPLKAWRSHEPVLPRSTDMTLGILDITSIGLKISVDTVHNLDVFCDLTGKKVGDIITREDIKRLILNPDMMFRSAQGKRVLFINKAENPITLDYARDLGREISIARGAPDTIVIGSLTQENYEVIKEDSQDALRHSK